MWSRSRVQRSVKNIWCPCLSLSLIEAGSLTVPGTCHSFFSAGLSGQQAGVILLSGSLPGPSTGVPDLCGYT